MDECYKALVEQPNARPPTSNRSGGQGKGQVEGSLSDGSRQGSVSSLSKTKHEDSKARRYFPREVFKEMQRVTMDSMGNLPADGHEWRKSYYRCARRNQQGCHATKQLQRLDNDPCMWEVTYRNKHVCRNVSFVPESAESMNLSANSGEAIPSPHPGTPGSPNTDLTYFDIWRDLSGACEQGDKTLGEWFDGPKRKQSHDDEPSEITEDSWGWFSELPATSMRRSKWKRVASAIKFINSIKGEASHNQKGKEKKEVAESILKEWRYLEPMWLTWSDLSREEMELLASEVMQKTEEGKLLFPLEKRFMEYYRLLACKTSPPGTGDYFAPLSEAEGMKEVQEKIRALRLEAEALSRRKDVLHLLSSYSMKPEVAINVFTLTSIFSRINDHMRDLVILSGKSYGHFDYITCRNIISRRIPELFRDVKALLAEAAFDTVPYSTEGMVQKLLWPDGAFPAPKAMYTLASDSAIRQAMKCIQERTFRSIGISGVGAKEVAKALTNLPEVRNMFSVVLCVSISRYVTIQDVERHIKQQIHAWAKRTKGIDISVPVDVPFQHYNCLLLLDCIDEPINLYALDIPGPSKTGLRLHVQTMLTTQAQKAYHVMPVDLEIRMEDHLLPWDVFCKNLGHASTVDITSLKPMAVRLVEECHGHLLAIILLARALNGVNDGGIWELARHELTSEPSSEIEGISKDMVNVLRFIWQRKGNASKHCIKYCTSHDKGTVFLRDLLISGWIRAGSVKTPEEGDDILKDLISSFLLEEVGETSFRMREETRLVLLNRFILRPHPVYLMQGGMGLTEAPNAKVWDAEEIHLMNNNLSEVPESPTCPFLQKLFLQINYDLTEIPLLFFEHMPVLQVLDLSYTSLKSLPSSISRLVALRELYLRGCELLMGLPPEIGALWNLKVLDLERTEVINLPKEIEDLVNLECFKVSLFGCAAQHTIKTKKWEAVSPRMSLSELTRLKELSIDVNPDCVGWCIELEQIMNELSSLSNLETLKLYIPTIELLQQFLQLTWSKNQLRIFPSLSHFSLTVGEHVRRIISYLPDDLEEKFEKQSKSKLPFSLEKSGYLKYTNGETNTDIIAEALKNASALFLDRHWTMGKLSVFKIDEINKLKYCLLVECSEMHTIVDGSDYFEGDNEYEDDEDDYDWGLKGHDYDDEVQYDLDLGERPALPSLQYLSIHYMKSLESIWKGPTVRDCLSNLKILALHTCPKLATIFTPGLLANLINLKELVAEDCSIISTLVSPEPSNSKLDSFLPSLKTISLLDLPELVNISCGLRIAPNLERMVVYNCPKLESLSPVEVSSKYVKEIKGESEWWDALKWPESEWSDGRPDYLVRAFVPLRGGGDLMDQLATAANSFEELM
ncbi:hypothetical protein RJ639_003579 [Escallonia herrerae]|uniref:WRKY domain-containing protein n=1 Tax=Escallonia herrerae TaxID=1293975 RepID=A0AA89AVJ2_9ASTE|nr:hypothetical protein RJ639_003579 [Escallonia herrerae]